MEKRSWLGRSGFSGPMAAPFDFEPMKNTTDGGLVRVVYAHALRHVDANPAQLTK